MIRDEFKPILTGFTLSFRDIEKMLAARGVLVSSETIQQGSLKCGQTYANSLRRKAPRRGDRWHFDEVYLTINGKHHYLWRAVDQQSNVLDILVQNRRNRNAVKRFFRKLLKGLLYAAAKKEIMPGVEHRQHKGLNNRAEVSHQPTRQKERQMHPFKSAEQVQRFLSAHGSINNLFRCRRHLHRRADYRVVREQAFHMWQNITDTRVAA